MKGVKAELRIEVEDQNELVRVPLWKSESGDFIGPSKGDLIIHNGKAYRVVDVTWNYDSNMVIAYAR